jgi:hypothetical protein
LPELQKRIRECRDRFPLPALFVYLSCQPEKRAARISLRGPVRGLLDDSGLGRAARYETAIRQIAQAVPDWLDVDTSDVPSAAVASHVLERLTPKEST